MFRRTFLAWASASALAPKAFAERAANLQPDPLALQRQYLAEFLSRIYGCSPLPKVGKSPGVELDTTDVTTFADFRHALVKQGVSDFQEDKFRIVDGWVLPEAEIKAIAEVTTR